MFSLPGNDKYDKRVKKSRKYFLIGLVCGLIPALLISIPDSRFGFNEKGVSGQSTLFDPDYPIDHESILTIEQLTSRIENLRGRYDAIKPKMPYVIVNTSDNEISLMQGDSLLHKGVCSTGSYVLLKASKNREWLFKTPRGRYNVLVKTENPVWRKPDWAYLEEGLPIPPRYADIRYEAGVLGKYAIGFGYGYLIHGTKFKRLLGMPVTHGCVRLGDEDMKIVFDGVKRRSRIYIY
ncbi:MAG: L,D-transpeptidase [Calditrichaceae bacterium]